MKILEKFILGKSENQNECEDGIVVYKSNIALIDGCTSKSNKLWFGKKSGCYAKDVLINSFKKYIDIEDPFDILINLNRELFESYSKYINKNDILNFLRASIIIFQENKKRIINYGDCNVIINGYLYNHSKKVDIINAKLRSDFIKSNLGIRFTINELLENDLGRDYIKENLKNQFLYENNCSTYSYPVLNGKKLCRKMMKVYNIKRGDEIVLASDGYPFPCSSLSESEEKLKTILREDPLCIFKFYSTKGLKVNNHSFDDRAYIRFIVN